MLGVTDYTEEEVEQIVRLLGKKYRGTRYHLLRRNCNHFASDFAKVRVEEILGKYYYYTSLVC